MKENFNIEDLKRKNIYNAPNDFYEDVRKNVLRETSLLNENKPSQKTRKLYVLAYAMAACFILLVGFTFIWNSNEEVELISYQESTNSIENKEKEIPVEVMEEQTEEFAHQGIALEESEDIKEELAEIYTEELNDIQTIAQENTFNKSKKTVKKVEKIPQSTLEFVHQQVVDIPKGELAEVTQNMENDIYLELYN